MIIPLHQEDLNRLIQARLAFRESALARSSKIPEQVSNLQTSEIRKLIHQTRRQAAFEANMSAFEAQKAVLQKKYPENSYVAMSRCIPVVMGDNRREVAIEFYDEYGPQPVYVGRLGEDLEVISLSPHLI